MKKISRILVLLFALILTQSSLGTTAARIYDQKLLQNGYRKYEDGFMLQWGYSTSSSGNKTVYMNNSFINTEYNVMLTLKSESNTISVVVLYVVSKSESSFIMRGRFITNGNTIGDASNPFYWIAIGRWK